VPDALDVVAAAVRALPPVRGRGRLGHVLFERSSRRGTWHVRMHGGYQVVIPRASRQGWAAAFTGRYDEEKLAVARDHVTPGSTVLDVGASLGFWTMMLAVRTSAGHVIAYEPVPGSRGVLERNVAMNDVGDRVRVEPYGLGERAEELVAITEAGGAGNAAVVTGADHADLPDRVTIAVRTLDSMGPTPSRCSFMKIDVEGYELAVLRGAEGFVAEHRPVILGEFSPHWSTERGYSSDAIETWASDHRYGVFELRSVSGRLGSSRRVALEPIAHGRQRSGADLLLVPRA
jgi:FkbM family methyltransferase